MPEPLPSALSAILDSDSPPHAPPTSTAPTRARVGRAPESLPAEFSVLPSAVLASSHLLADDVEQAYNACLAAEQRSHWNAATVETDIVLVRLVGWMMQKAPTAIAREAIARELLASDAGVSAPHRVRDLGHLYAGYIVRIFRASTERTPDETPPLSSPLSNTRGHPNEAPQTHDAAKEQALVRDGYRCMVTDRVDYPSRHLTQRVPGDGLTYTECCYIISQTTPENTQLEESTARPHQCTSDALEGEARSAQGSQYADSAWTVLSRFAGLDPHVFKKPSGANVHELCNILTLELNTRKWFESLQLWFEATNEAHTYNVVAPYVLVDEKRMMGLPDTVKFVSSQPELLPLPDPRLLKIHAACAEVAYLSGAAEYIDEIIDGMDEGATNVLAEDGSSYALVIAFARRADIAVC